VRQSIHWAYGRHEVHNEIKGTWHDVESHCEAIFDCAATLLKAFQWAALYLYSIVCCARMCCDLHSHLLCLLAICRCCML
jgi:hypothetical protein